MAPLGGRMRQKAIKEEAERLVRELGPSAYEAALKEMQKAKRAKNLRLERYKTQVAMATLRLSGTVTVEAD
jgi:hypothetical protein